MKIFTFLPACILMVVLLSCYKKGNNNKPGHVKINDQGVNIAYTDNGKGDTTLLFVHGWCINKTYWTQQVDFFSKKYRVVTIDLPGFGKSGKNRKEWTTVAFGRDIDSVMSQLKLKNVILIGHSMAGDIILQAAANLPGKVIGIIGVDNFKGVGHKYSARDTISYNQAVDSLGSQFKKNAFAYVNQSLFYKTTADSIKKRVLNDVAKANPVIATACMKLNGFDETKQLILLKRKLYLINSDVNKTDTTGFKASQISFQIKYIHATGHFPMIEKPAEFDTALQEILTAI